MSSVICLEKLFVFFVILINMMMFGEALHVKMKGYVCRRVSLEILRAV